MVDRTDGKGHEQRGYRPAIVGGYSLSIVTVIPITSRASAMRFPYTPVLTPAADNGLDVNSTAPVFQMVTLDESRFTKKIGHLASADMEAIHALIKLFFNLPWP